MESALAIRASRSRSTPTPLNSCPRIDQKSRMLPTGAKLETPWKLGDAVEAKYLAQKCVAAMISNAHAITTIIALPRAGTSSRRISNGTAAELPPHPTPMARAMSNTMTAILKSTVPVARCTPVPHANLSSRLFASRSTAKIPSCAAFGGSRRAATAGVYSVVQFSDYADDRPPLRHSRLYSARLPLWPLLVGRPSRKAA